MQFVKRATFPRSIIYDVQTITYTACLIKNEDKLIWKFNIKDIEHLNYRIGIEASNLFGLSRYKGLKDEIIVSEEPNVDLSYINYKITLLVRLAVSKITKTGILGFKIVDITPIPLLKLQPIFIEY